MRAAARSRKGAASESAEDALGTWNERAALFGAHLDADQSALQRDVCAVPIDVGIVGGQALLGASQRILGALRIAFFGALGGFFKFLFASLKNLGKALTNREIAGLLAAA